MKRILLFKSDNVLTLINHALASKEFRPTIDQAYNEDFTTKKTPQQIKETVRAGLWLVKDMGVYLMSNGSPSLYRWQVDKKFKKSIQKNCETYKKELLTSTTYWRDRVHDFVDAQNMDAVEFATKFKVSENSLTVTNTQYVVYAKDCQPNKDINWYENSRYIVGGDDCTILIPTDLMLLIKETLEVHKRKQVGFLLTDEDYRVIYR